MADSNDNRIMRWLKRSRKCSIIVDGNGAGEQLNQFYYLRYLSFGRQGTLYVVDFRWIIEFQNLILTQIELVVMIKWILMNNNVFVKMLF